MKTAVCPGSFDPITVGHLDIIKRGSKIFDKIIVLVMTNTEKSYMFSSEERIDFIKKSAVDCINVEAEAYSGLLTDFCRERNINIILKGVRFVRDFEYEYQISCVNKRLNPDLETILLYSSDDHRFLSSTVAREMIIRGGDLKSIVPDEIIHSFNLRKI